MLIRSGDKGIEIWEIDESTTSAKYVKRFQHKSVEMGWINGMAWDERTKCLAACSSRGWITIWSMDSDQPIHATKIGGTWLSFALKCLKLAWRPNGKQTEDDEGVDVARKSADNFILVCGMYSGRIVIWTPLKQEKTRILISRHSDWIDSLSFSPDGRFLASTDEDWKLIIWATENWEPVYIDAEEKIRGGRFSWLSPSTDVPDYKLTFNSNDGKVHVIEYAVGQSEKPSEDKSDMSERIAKEKETRGEWSIGSSGVPDLT